MPVRNLFLILVTTPIRIIYPSKGAVSPEQRFTAVSVISGNHLGSELLESDNNNNNKNVLFTDGLYHNVVFNRALHIENLSLGFKIFK